MDPMTRMKLALGASAAAVAGLIASALVLSTLCLWFSTWLMDMPKRGFWRSLFTLLASGLLTLLSYLFLSWIPWVGGPLASLVAWFLGVATIEEVHDSTLSRAAVAGAVSGILTLWASLAVAVATTGGIAGMLAILHRLGAA